jgi:hypothetical protein
MKHITPVTRRPAEAQLASFFGGLLGLILGAILFWK